MSNKGQASRGVTRLIRGLQLIEDAVTGVSFYNSSGGDAGFALNRELTTTERETLKSLGFKDVHSGTRDIGFHEWSDQ